jgi:hypothetical protein
MHRARLFTLLLLVGPALAGRAPVAAQVRVTPKEAKGGEKQGAAWAEVPEAFKHLKVPDWPVPTDLKRWRDVDRAKTRKTLLGCLGEMPDRPDPRKVRVLSREDKGDYTLERIEFHNGVDMTVPGILLVPKGVKAPMPAIVTLHGHGSSKESVLTDPRSSQLIGPMLARRGYVVAAIDACFNGARRPGPGWTQPRQGRLSAGTQPVQALLVAGPHPVGDDAARGAVPARLPGDASGGRQAADRRHRHEHGLHARLPARTSLATHGVYNRAGRSRIAFERLPRWRG